MPCNTRTETTLELANPHSEMLAAALKAAGFTLFNAYGIQRVAASDYDRGIDVTLLDTGRLTVSTASWSQLDNAAACNLVRRAYSAEVVKQAARRFHWTLKQPDIQRQVYIAERR